MLRSSHAALAGARLSSEFLVRPCASRRLVRSRGLATVVTPRAKEPTELDKVTALANGVRVASEDLPDAFSGVGVYIDAGSRYENEYLRGASHIMDRLAFKATSSRSADEMLAAVEQLGGNVQCASSRESMMYQAATFNKAIPTTVGLLAETIREPALADDEIQAQLQTAEYEVKEIWSKPDLILPELVHMAAFKDNTLGNPLLCPEPRLRLIDKAVVQTYRQLFFRPDRVVVAFAGVPHAEAVRLTEQYFGDMHAAVEPQPAQTGFETPRGLLDTGSSDALPASLEAAGTGCPPSPQQPRKLLSQIPFFKNLSTSASNRGSVQACSPVSQQPTPAEMRRPAQYTGGFLTLPNLPISPNPNMANLSHIHLAFEGLSVADDDIFALATLQTLLGGGGSFSAGGPGKGMYSRLYTNVLNQHGWVESCVAFNHSYTDSGLFGIAASCLPGRTADMLTVMCRELSLLMQEPVSPNRVTNRPIGSLSPAEVSRAKNQLRSGLLMNLESRMVELEDLGRQVQIHGRKVPVGEMTSRIAALTPADLSRVATRVLGGLVTNPGTGSGAPTVVLQEADAPGTGPAGRATIGWEAIQDVVHEWGLGK